jgi:hypothetical protein
MAFDASLFPEIDHYQSGWFDKPVLSAAEGLTANGKSLRPFVLSLSKARSS